MNTIKLIVLVIVLLAIAVAAIGIKLFFNKNAKIPAGNCRNRGNDKTLSCTCGNSGKCDNS